MIKEVKQKFSLFLILIFVISNFFIFDIQAAAQSPTAWWQDINQPTTWTLANSPYLIPWNSSININDVLIIEPGVIIKFAPDYYTGRYYSGLVVNGANGGKIIALGSDSQPIVFTSRYDRDYASEIVADYDPSAMPGDWFGFVFNNDHSILEHIIVRYAGETNRHYVALEFSQGSQAQVSHSLIERSQGSGLMINNNGQPILDNLIVQDNLGYALSASQTAGPGILKNSLIQNNQGQYIFDIQADSLFTFNNNRYLNNNSQAISLSGSVTRSVTLFNLAAPYVISRELTIEPTGMVNIEPGVILKFDQVGASFSRMLVKGNLQAIGSQSQPIILTAFEDDVAGDSNQDGQASAPQPGDWGELAFENSNGSKLENVEIRYAGSYYGGFSGSMYTINHNNSIYLKNSQVEINHSLISHGYNYGIFQEQGGSFSLTNSKIAGHQTGIFISADSSPLPEIKDSSIYDNSSYGLYYAGSEQLDASYNWWGSDTGPNHPANLSGMGDRISGNVKFNPWHNQFPQLIPAWRQRVEPGDILYDLYAWGVGHIGLYAGDDKVIEAQGRIENYRPAGKVRENNISSWDYPNRKNIYLLRVKKPTGLSADAFEIIKNNAIQFTTEQIGDDYNWKWKTKSSSPNSASWYCSELVWAAYFNQGIDLEYSHDLANKVSPISPAEIYWDDDTYVVDGHIENIQGLKNFSLLLILSPVEVTVTDQDGHTLSKDMIDIPGATYIEDDVDQNGQARDVIALPNNGQQYQIEVIKQPAAGADETYSLIIKSDGGQTILAQDKTVPAVGQSDNYFFQSSLPESETGSSGYLDQQNSAQNSFSVGTLDLAVSPSDLGLVDLASEINFTLTNKGSLNFEYVIQSQTSGSADFCADLKITIYKNDSLQYSGDLNNLNLTQALAGSQDNWKFMLADPANHLIGQTCNFDFNFQAWQSGLNLGQGFADSATISASVASAAVAPPSADVVLNEFLPNPIGDDFAARPNGEWVELYNNGDSAIDLTDYYLTDVDNNKIEVESCRTNTGDTIINAHDFLVVYRKGDGSLCTSHNFSLNNDGDTLNFYDSVDVLLDSYSYDVTTENKSYARIPDGSGDFIDPVPTPGRKNELETTYENI